MKKKKPTLLLGAHMSIAGGLEKSIEQGESIDCTCIQIFTKSNRQWKATPLKKESVEAFKSAYKKSPLIQCVAAHTSYLINIGSPNKEINKKSVDSLELELKRAETLAIPYLILHPGSHGASTPQECIELIAQRLNEVLERNQCKTIILLENMGGQGSAVGYTFEQLAEIYKKIKNKKRVGFCFDTCHAFVAGYDFRDKKSYNALWKEFDHILGINNIKVFHINDSKKELGSRVDRHEDIGKGKLGLEPFRLLFNDKKFYDIPKILETPKEKDLKDDIKNINTIKKLLNSSTKKNLEVK